ncbi:glycosyltransferase [Rivularia sp. UHCC 0363]|uniref:glycosyltransferase n=1 Tax=Rivularia sp. UHCC 0363 TaxID=3110244 RepID=UPI002B21F42C|nr:glycosyltransferase [Rivularia sp. UHCC 0363]MEA5597651.1 glycosyltransferase [Rivularia sp. UHCC 0363]
MLIKNRSLNKFVIVFITTDLDMGGAEIMLYNLLSKINRQRFCPVVVSLIDGGVWGNRIKALGIPVHTIKMQQGRPTPTGLLRLIKTVNQLKPDIIQGWMYHGNLAAQLASIFSAGKIRVFWSIHHSPTSLSSERIMTRAIIKVGANISQFNHKVIFVSQNSQKLHEQLGYNSDNSCVIPNGFDTDLFKHSVTAKRELRDELNLPESSLMIGLICRYHPMKDHANFLKAAALIANNYSEVNFILAGTDVDENNTFISRLIEELNISSQVHLLGERHDIDRILAGLDIVSLSSAYGEAFPLVIGEAMSCGVPCVVTDVGDSGLIVGHTGKIVPPSNSQALANAWKDLISIGAEGREVLGKAARERIIASFSLESVVNRYEKLYETAFKNAIPI